MKIRSKRRGRSLTSGRSLIGRLNEVFRWDESIQVDFGKRFERFRHDVCGDTRTVRKGQTLTCEIQGGVVLADGMAVLRFLVMFARACRAVISCYRIEDADLVGVGVSDFTHHMCHTKQGSGGHIDQKHRNHKCEEYSDFQATHELVLSKAHYQ